MNIFVGIILFALLFGITNTMLMSVMERVREFGVLMAVGMKRSRVFFMIIMETISLSFIGGIIGLILALILIQYFGSVGINLSAFTEGLISMEPWNKTLYKLTIFILSPACINDSGNSNNSRFLSGT